MTINHVMKSLILICFLALTAMVPTSPAGAAGECKEFYKEYSAKPDFKVMVKGKKKGQKAGEYQCFWGWDYPTLEEAKKSLLADCKREAKSCVVEYATNEKKYYSKIDRVDLCKKALASGATGWDTSALFSKHVAEGKRRGLSVDDCRVTIGLSKLQNQPSVSSDSSIFNSLSELPNSSLCVSALTAGRESFSSGSALATEVAEAKRRGLSVDDCRVAIGLSKLQNQPSVSSDSSIFNSLSELPNSSLCVSALTAGRESFSSGSALATEVAEAKRRGLSVDDCRVAIGLASLTAPPSQTPTLAEVNPPTPKPLSLNEICEQSLNSDKTDWSTASSASDALKQADIMGVTVEICRVTLGIKDDQKTADIPAVNDQNADNSPSISPSAPLQKKVALVIGNSAYEHSPVLANPHNDAEAVAKTLIGVGFEVISGLDLTNAETEKKAREFAKAAKTADVSLLYYAGHGLQIAGENYIVPVDAKVEDETAISFELINVSKITNFMGGLDKVGIILLDACRDNPFSRSLKRSLSASRAASVDQGLAPISAEGGGLFVAFSTAPGDVAADGEGMTNSPFTTALLKHLPTKGLEINTVMTRVKAEVAKMTKNDQRPWTNSDLTTEVYLVPTK